MYTNSYWNTRVCRWNNSTRFTPVVFNSIPSSQVHTVSYQRQPGRSTEGDDNTPVCSLICRHWAWKQFSATRENRWNFIHKRQQASTVEHCRQLTCSCESAFCSTCIMTIIEWTSP